MDLKRVHEFGTAGSKHILPGDAELNELANSPAQSCVQPYVAGNRPCAKRPDAVGRRVPLQVVCEIHGGSQLGLTLGRIAWCCGERGILAGRIKPKLHPEEAETRTDSPPTCHAPVCGKLDAVIACMPQIIPDIRKYQMGRRRTQREKRRVRLQSLEAAIVTQKAGRIQG